MTIFPNLWSKSGSVLKNGVKEIELHRGDDGLGFNIRGGNDAPYVKEDFGIFVTKIRDSGAAKKV